MLNRFRFDLIKKNDSLLLAISGGIDSMVLLDIIVKLKERLNLIVAIAHVDHQKRESSKDDCDFVIDAAKNLNLPFFVKNLESRGEENFHNYAHKQRYEFFYQIAKENNINKIVLAHNANDNAETVLMRLSRGSSYEGYRGILAKTKYKDIEIIRPLITVPRSEIAVYQQVNLVAYQNDPTNELDDYTRNRYRHHILPLLMEENPRFLDKIQQFSLYQSQSYELIDSLSSQFLVNNQMAKNELKISELLKVLPIIQIEVIKKTINLVTNDSVEVSWNNLNDILEMISNPKPHLKFILENKLYISKSYDKLLFQTAEIELENYSYLIDDFKEISLPNNYLLSVAKNANKNYGFIGKLCYNNLDLLFPLTVRNRANGDKVITDAGTKKLKDILIDKKVPIHDRDTLPVVLNKDGEIIFVPGIFTKKTSGKNELYIAIKRG